MVKPEIPPLTLLARIIIVVLLFFDSVEFLNGSGSGFI